MCEFDKIGNSIYSPSSLPAMKWSVIVRQKQGGSFFVFVLASHRPILFPGDERKGPEQNLCLTPDNIYY